MEVTAGYNRTEAGVIPQDWQLRSIADLVDPASPICYGVVQVGRHAENGIPIIAIKFVKEIAYAPLHRTAAALERPYARSRIKEGDVLISIKGTIGRVGIVPSGFQGNISRELARLRISRDTCSEYVAHQLEADASQERIMRSVVGTTRLEFSIAALRQFTLPIPSSKSEQQSIAAALSDVDALLAGLDRLIAKKRDLKQAAMQQLLTGQTRLPGFHGDWETKRLGDVVRQCFSGATPRRNRPEFYQGSVRWITSGELNYNLITDTIEKITEEAVAETNLSILPVGTFLMAITGLEAEGTRGACGIVGAPSATNQSCMAVFPTSELLTEYLFHYYVYRGKSLALKYCQGTKQQSYTAGLVKHLPISLPPSTAEQRAIASVLSDMDAELTALEARRDKTRALKQGMVQELLTGRTRLL